MSKNFRKSEIYRKYVIGFNFQNFDLYTVWGTDLIDNENDKLIVKGEKLLAFRSLNELEEELRHMSHPFRDDDNFTKWVCEENLQQVYNNYDFKLFADFDLKLLRNESDSLMLLNCINLIQDFALQVNSLRIEEILDQPNIKSLKDFIYVNYFWKKDDNIKVEVLKDTNVSILFRNLYNEFISHIDIR